jgi:hypothetical protein
MSLTTHVKSEFAHKLAKEETETTQQNVMRLNLKLLRIAGIAMPPNLKPNTCRKILNEVQVVCFQALYLPLFVGQVLALYHFWGDLDICTNNIFTLLAAIISYGEGAYAKFYAKEIVQLFETFQNKVVTKMTTVGFKGKKKEIFDSATKKARLMTFIMIATLDIMAISWIPGPFIRHFMEEHKNVTNNEIDDKKRWLNFCFVVWYPIDLTVSPYFEIVYVIQTVAYILGTTYLKAVDMTVGAMMVHISAQFEILCIALKDIDMVVSNAEEKKKELRILQPRAVDVRLEDSDELPVRGAGSLGERDLHECETTHVRGHADNTEMKNEDFSEPTCYLAHVVQYHQAIIE